MQTSTSPSGKSEYNKGFKHGWDEGIITLATALRDNGVIKGGDLARLNDFCRLLKKR